MTCVSSPYPRNLSCPPPLQLVQGVGVTGVAADVAVLQVAMPPMVTASIVASDHDLDPELGTAMVGVGLLVSLLSIPLWHLVLQLVA